MKAQYKSAIDFVKDLTEDEMSLEDSLSYLDDLDTVHHEEMSDSDMDHGCWTNTHVIEHNGRFFEFYIEHHMQGEIMEWEDTEVKEVFEKKKMIMYYE